MQQRDSSLFVWTLKVFRAVVCTAGKHKTLPGFDPGLLQCSDAGSLSNTERLMTKLNPPRQGTKAYLLLTSLSGDGATLRALTKRLDWKAHTVRAALTRLRQRGYAIERVRAEGAVSSTYRLKTP